MPPGSQDTTKTSNMTPKEHKIETSQLYLYM